VTPYYYHAVGFIEIHRNKALIAYNSARKSWNREVGGVVVQVVIDGERRWNQVALGFVDLNNAASVLVVRQVFTSVGLRERKI